MYFKKLLNINPLKNTVSKILFYIKKNITTRIRVKMDDRMSNFRNRGSTPLFFTFKFHIIYGRNSAFKYGDNYYSKIVSLFGSDSCPACLFDNHA